MARQPLLIYTERSVPKKLTWTLAIFTFAAWIPISNFADSESRQAELRRCEQEAMYQEDKLAGIAKHNRRGQPPSEFLSCPGA